MGDRRDRRGWSRRGALAGLCALPFAPACLPHTALGRHEELPATRYRLTARVLAAPLGSEGQAAAVWSEWRLSAELDAMYSRTFRDGSLGTLIRFASASAVIDGAAARCGLAGLLVEVRAFDRGEVLAVQGADVAFGPGGRLELLDLWPLFAPRLEAEGRRSGPGWMRTTWPVGESPGWGRARAELSGEQDRGAWSLRGSVGQEDALVRRSGEAEAAWEIAPEGVARATLRQIRRVEPGWGGPAQDQRVEVALERAGDAPPLPIVPPDAYDSGRADAARAQLVDGSGPRPDGRPAVEVRPFVLVPEWERA